MKNLRILPLLLTFIFLGGCGLIDELQGLQEIDFDIELYASKDVDIGPDDSSEIDEPIIIDGTTNADIAEYINDIVEYDIWNIYIMVPEYKGEDDILFEGTIKIGDYSEDFYGMNALNPSMLYNTQSYLYLSLNQAALTSLNQTLIDTHKLTGSVVGTVSGKPVAFTLDFYIEATVYAEIKK